jgi:hypothetical protein
MAYELREGQGSLFVNDRRQNDTQPTHTGTARLAGQMWRLAAWCRETNSGARVLSLKFTPLERDTTQRTQESAQAPKSTAPAPEGFNDDIPF